MIGKSLSLTLLIFLINIGFGLSYDQTLNEKHTFGYDCEISRIGWMRNGIKNSIECGASYPLITFMNSSSAIQSVLFGIDDHSICRLSPDSLLCANDCMIEILSSCSGSAFICEGEIRMERLKIESEYSMGSIVESTPSQSSISDKSCSCIEIKDSCFRDIEVNSFCGGLISRENIGREGVTGCLFENVSKKEEDGEEKRERRRLLRREECIICDSMISGGENGIYGVIVSGIMEGNNGRGYSFISSNNSFIECLRSKISYHIAINEEYKDTNYTSQLNLSTTSSHTFTNCTFTNCTSSDRGGAISFSSSTTTTCTVTITSCTFTNCSASRYGGAVCCTAASSCVVSGCSFVNCKTTSYYGGGIYLYYISRCAGVKDSNISSCSAGLGGGIVIEHSNVTGTDCEGGVEYGIVSGCRFSDCNTTNHGGGIELYNISISTVRSCSIYNCHARYGGGIRWSSPTSEQISLSEWIFDCVFELNSATEYGHDVYFYTSSYNRTESIFDDLCYTLSDQVNRVIWNYFNTSDHEYTHDDWLPYGGSFDGYIYINGSKNSSTSSCGVWSDVCGSLSGGIESSYYTSSAFSGIVLMEGIHSNDKRGIDVGANTLPIRSNGVVEFDVPSTFSSTSSVFIISSGRLNMNGFTIVLKKNIGSECSLVSISGGGSVILNSMTISGGSLNYGTSNTPLMDIGSGSISCDNVTFKNLTRLSGNGTIFEFISLSTSISLCNMTFNNCRCESGSGGAISVTLSSSSYTLTLSLLTFTSCSASGYGGGVYIDGGRYISTSTLAFSSLSFTSCSSTNAGNGIWISASSLSLIMEYDGWNTLLPSDYSSDDDGVYIAHYSTRSFNLLHLLYTPSNLNVRVMCVETVDKCTDTPTCGWEDFPCKTIGYEVSLDTTLLREVNLLYSSSGHEAESEGVAFIRLESILIEGEEGESGVRVEKDVSNMNGVLFTLKYCENVTFSSIAFIIHSSSLSHSLFFCTFSSLTLSSISITPSDSTTLTQLNESLIVSASGCNINIHGCMFECVELKDGNGSAMNSRVADDCTFVVVNTSFSNCSAMYGGGVYVDISGHPLLVNMSEVIYEGNNASKEGMTLYVVWRSISNMESNEFSSFVGLSEEMDGGEAKVERWNGGIVRLEEFVRGGWMSGYGVNAQIEISEDVGMIVVEVVEDGGGEGGVVGMEGGEVSGEVVMGGSGVGEVNGEGVRVSMGNALTRVLQRCENIEIVMNVTYGGSNG